MRKTPFLGLAVLVGAGLISVPIATNATASGSKDNPAYLKRDDHVSDLVLVSHDDDDDDTGVTGQTRTRTRGGADTAGTRHSRRGDASRGARVRDMTRDGGRLHVDRSRHHTNDRSRHNTRG